MNTRMNTKYSSMINKIKISTPEAPIYFVAYFATNPERYPFQLIPVRLKNFSIIF